VLHLKKIKELRLSLVLSFLDVTEMNFHGSLTIRFLSQIPAVRLMQKKSPLLMIRFAALSVTASFKAILLRDGPF